jgi:Raf kinase inhibitor-like YbhB/YbcL family protein
LGDYSVIARCHLLNPGGLRFKALLVRAMVALFAWSALPGCHGARPETEDEGSSSLVLHSASLRDGRFPEAFTCTGANTSPALNWNQPPAGTKSLTLILNDPDAPSGTFVHWVLFNLPAATASLPAGLPAQPQLPDGSRQGRNDFGDIGYEGPCPPGHSQHHYLFMLFALDTKLNLAPGATRDQIDAAMRGHIVARGSLAASFSR